MKYLFVLTLCATAAFAEVILDKTLLKKFEADCIIENKLNAAALEGAKTLEPFKDTCFALCFGKKMGTLKQDGTLDMDNILTEAKTPEKKEKARKMLNTVVQGCTAEAGNDLCKMAHCLHSEMTESRE